MPRGVMAGCEKRGGNRLTCLHLDAADLKWLQRQPAGLHDRRVVAQDLLDGIGHELGLAVQFGELIRMFEQRKHAIADQVRSGEIASDKQEVAGNDNLALGQPILRLSSRDERANKIGAAPAASLFYCTSEIIIEALPRCRQLCGPLGRPRQVEDLRPRIRPALELRQIAGRDSEHLGDDNNWQWGRVFGDHIERVLTAQRVKQLVSDGANARTEGVHRTLVERLGNKPSETLMVGLIKLQHRLKGFERLVCRQDAPKVRIRLRLARIDRE
jgi:hypothetical protein